MAERVRELAAFPALPAQRFGRWTTSSPGRSAAPRNAGRRHVGELYLELHRGTLTSQGRTKRAHRRAERDLVAAEVLGALTALGGERCPRRWSRTGGAAAQPVPRHPLGRSDREVAEEAEAELAEAAAAAGEVIEARLAELGEWGWPAGGGEEALMAVNPTSRRGCARALPWAFPGAQPVAGGGAVVSSALEVAGLEAVAVRGASPAGGLV